MLITPALLTTVNANGLENTGSNGEIQGLWTDYAANRYACGNGTKESPYLISNASELALLAKNVNEMKEDNKYYELISDIDLSGHYWNPIGNNDDTNIGFLIGIKNVFKGYFNGNSYTISNMSMQQIDNVCFYGLFGYFSKGKIENINLNQVNISINTKNDLYVGSIAGSNSGKVSNCHIFQSNLDLYSSKSLFVGGILGDMNYAEMNNCSVEANINCCGENAIFVGGADGSIANETNVSNCMSNCQIKTESVGAVDENQVGEGYSYCYYVGGFAGQAGRANSNVSVRNCYAEGTVNTSSKSNKCDGGMFAGNSGVIRGSAIFENLVTSVVVTNNGIIENYFNQGEGIGGYPNYKYAEICKHNNLITIYNQTLKVYSYVNEEAVEDYYDLSKIKINDALEKCGFSFDDWCMKSNKVGLYLYKEEIINSGTNDVKKKYTCVTCGDIYTKDFIEKTAHQIVVDLGDEATCTKYGLTEGSHCSICYKIFKNQILTPPLGHDYKDGICTRCHKEISGQWRKSGNKWWYEYEDGTYPINEFVTINHQLYSFDQSGYMQTGWFKIDGVDYYASAGGEIKAQWVASGSNWYYVNAQGKMVTGRQTINGAQYYFSESGLMQKGWFKIDDVDYYASAGGEIKAQWVASGNNWYYVDSVGKIVTGRQIINGAQYYFAENGLMQKGWFEIDNDDYYASAGGEIKAQWVASGSNWYYVDAEGKMVTGYQTINGAQYYFAESGLMQSGWFKINGEYYYASSSGSIQAQWVKSGSYWYYVDDNGKMVTGDYEIDGEVNHFDNEGIWLG